MVHPVLGHVARRGRVARAGGVDMKTENTGKHYTPGFWQKIRRHDGRPCVVTLDENDNLEHVVAGPSTTLHNEQDLQLISAAPELLQACRAALYVLLADSDMEEDCEQEIKQIKAAIAKAEGGKEL